MKIIEKIKSLFRKKPQVSSATYDTSWITSELQEAIDRRKNPPNPIEKPQEVRISPPTVINTPPIDIVKGIHNSLLWLTTHEFDISTPEAEKMFLEVWKNVVSSIYVYVFTERNPDVFVYWMKKQKISWGIKNLLEKAVSSWKPSFFKNISNGLIKDT